MFVAVGLVAFLQFHFMRNIYDVVVKDRNSGYRN